MSETVYQLIIRKGPKPGQTIPLTSVSISIGRDPMSDIPLNDPEVSRYHAQMTRTNSGYQLQDMGSTNGTFVDDQRLGSEPVQLEPGQTILFGSGLVLGYGVANEESSVETMVENGFNADTDSEPTFESTGGDHYLPEDLPEEPDFDEPPAVPFADADVPSPAFVAMDDQPAKKRRSPVLIALVILLILLCCCCAFLFIMYQWGGDWLCAQNYIDCNFSLQ